MSPVEVRIKSITTEAIEIWVEIIEGGREKIISAIIPIAEIINGRPAIAVGYFSTQVGIVLRTDVFLVFLLFPASLFTNRFFTASSYTG
jgi:hypothetical protein